MNLYSVVIVVNSPLFHSQIQECIKFYAHSMSATCIWFYSNASFGTVLACHTNMLEFFSPTFSDLDLDCEKSILYNYIFAFSSLVDGENQTMVIEIILIEQFDQLFLVIFQTNNIKSSIVLCTYEVHQNLKLGCFSGVGKKILKFS